MSNQAETFDWAGALVRLDNVRLALEQSLTPSSEELAAIYRERAARLAKSAADAPTAGAANTMIVFRVGALRYALLASDVEEVLPDTKIAAVPGASAAVMGAIQVRGAIRPVYNLLVSLGIDGPAPAQGPIIVVNSNRICVGVRVTAVEDIRPVGLRPPAEAGDTAAIAWTTEDFVSVLNPRALWRKEGRWAT